MPRTVRRRLDGGKSSASRQGFDASPSPGWLLVENPRAEKPYLSQTPTIGPVAEQREAEFRRCFVERLWHKVPGKQLLRGLARQPGFTATVVGILGLGLALATTVFSVVDALVLDPFPFPDANRLLVVGTVMPELALDEGYFERLSGLEIAEVGAASETLVAPLAFDLGNVRARLGETPSRLFAGYFASDPFVTLGVSPALGRGFLAEDLPGTDETTSRQPVAIVSDDLWRVQLGADPAILGRDLSIDGVAYTVVGVMPPHTNLYGTDLWLTLEDPLETMPRTRRQLNLIARQAEGVSHQQVTEELALIAGRIEGDQGSAHPEYADWRLVTTPWHRFASFTYRQEAVLTLGAVLFVLLLVCANLSNLLLSQATHRRPETALRRALGAREGHLLGQAMAEIAIFATLGGLLAYFLAQVGIAWVGKTLPTALQGSGRLPAFDGRTLLFLAFATLLATGVAGLAPAWHRLRSNPSLLGRGGPRSTHDRSTRRLHGGLVVAQIALAVVLLSGAAGLVQGFLALARTDLGFDTESLISMRLTLPRSEYDEAAIAPFFETLRQQVAETPGVLSASLASQLPPFVRFGGRLQIAGTDDGEDPEAGAPVFHSVVGDHFFRTLGQPLVRGRGLDDRDRSDGPVALVLNRHAAETFFPGREALGQRVRVVGGSFDTGWGEVVGIVESVRHQGPDQPIEPEVFSHHRQDEGRWNQLFLTVRTSGDPYALLPTIRHLVQGLDPDQPVYAISTVDEILGFLNAPRRVAAGVLGGFGLAALLLAALGIYAVVAFSVARRGREMGLRMALGAQRGEIVGLVLRETLGRIALGLGVGLLGVAGLTRVFGTQLGSAAELEPTTLVLTALTLATAGVVATLGPASRASRVAPVVALRDE